MKKYMVILPLSAVTIFVAIPSGASAQLVIGQVLNQTVGRVIRAMDLEVQRFQNRTIWLQDAQKALENQLSKIRLSEIAAFSKKQEDLFIRYYRELWQVKTAIAWYVRLTDLAGKQATLLQDYERAWSLLKVDQHFSADELAYMGRVYSGILQASVNDLDQLMAVVQANQTQMPDAARLKLVDQAAGHMDRNAADLQKFTRENELLSLQRAEDENEVKSLRRHYGLE